MNRRVDRVLYPPWAIRSIRRGRFLSYMQMAETRNGLSRRIVAADVLGSFLRHDTAPMDYFYFQFFSLNDAERSQYVSSLQLHRFQVRMNSPEARRLAQNKVESLHKFSPFVHRRWFHLPRDTQAFLAWCEATQCSRIVLKRPRGVAGRDVRVVKVRSGHS